MNALGNLVTVQEPDPTLGIASTNYTYDILNHLIQVSMPRGANTQTRTFNYNVGTVVGIDLLSATNPENGTIAYTYNPDHTLHTKNNLTYSYDSYKRLTQIMDGSTVLRTFMYDTNTLDGTYSGSYTAGRLVAVQHAAFTPQGYIAGVGGSNISIPSSMQLIEMYNYKQSGLTGGKRLQVNETLHYYISGVVHDVPKTRNLDGTYTYDNEGKMTSVNYPTTYAWNGTLVAPTSGPTYTYAFDAMHRPNSLTDQNGLFVVSNVTYNAANQLLTMGNETHTYNSLNQMTHLTITGNLDITYTFPAGTNNGKIGSQKDNLSGETVTYQYDSLNRLLSASSSQAWTETYGFDGFGNLVSKTPTGGAPALSIAVDPATNHIVGQTYDGSGNQTSTPFPAVYDAENRLEFISSAGVHYRYDSRNKRIWKSTLTAGNLTQEVYFYGVDGQKLGTYTLQLFLSSSNVPDITDSNTGLAIFFGGKRLGTYDRLGTAKYDQQNGQPMSFYPYGEDRGTVQPNDSLKFATYTRDTATGLDYADQRYYANNFGRFMSTDPYQGSARQTNPASWNRYAYALEDPVNFNDPSGLSVPDCNDLLSQINQFVFGDPDTGFKGIFARYFEQIYGRDAPGSTEWDGHNQQIRSNQRGLKQLMKDFIDDKCPPPSNWKYLDEWANKPLPNKKDYKGPSGAPSFLRYVIGTVGSYIFFYEILPSILDALPAIAEDSLLFASVDSSITFGDIVSEVNFDVSSTITYNQFGEPSGSSEDVIQ